MKRLILLALNLGVIIITFTTQPWLLSEYIKSQKAINLYTNTTIFSWQADIFGVKNISFECKS
jgi:hypothetical protein